MRESRTYGSVRGALSNERPYRDAVEAKDLWLGKWMTHKDPILTFDQTILATGSDGVLGERESCCPDHSGRWKFARGRHQA